MSEPYTIHIFVVEGDPDGVKIVDRLDWTGWGIAFPRSAWPRILNRRECGTSGVYILRGSSEGSSDELPTIYVGQGDKIRTRLDSHQKTMTLDWGYVFIRKPTALNSAHTRWIEYALIDRAKTRLSSATLQTAPVPKEPNLSEGERMRTQSFLNGDCCEYYPC